MIAPGAVAEREVFELPYGLREGPPGHRAEHGGRLDGPLRGAVQPFVNLVDLEES